MQAVVDLARMHARRGTSGFSVSAEPQPEDGCRASGTNFEGGTWVVGISIRRCQADVKVKPALTVVLVAFAILLAGGPEAFTT